VKRYCSWCSAHWSSTRSHPTATVPNVATHPSSGSVPVSRVRWKCCLYAVYDVSSCSFSANTRIWFRRDVAL